MTKKVRVLALVLAMVLVSVCLKAEEEDIAIIDDIKIELIREKPEIKIASNVPIEYLDYTLEAPYRIIVDPLGVVYSNLKENVFSGNNLVQSVNLVKTKGDLPAGLDKSYYPLDFIIIELDKSVYYDILRQEKLVVRLGDEKARKPVAAERPKVVERPEVKVEIVEVEPEKGPGGAPLAGEEFFDESKFPLVGRYRIESGDELEISIWQHPDLMRKVVVRPDGYISYPLAGEVRVSGLTTDRLAREIAIRVSRILRKPEVSVIVTNFSSKSIFVLGAVKSPGVYPYNTKMTTLKAVSTAGSWESHAYIKSVLVVKRFFTGEVEVRRVNLWNVVKDGKVQEDIVLEPGDIVYVPRSFIGNIGTFLDGLRGGLSAGASRSLD